MEVRAQHPEQQVGIVVVLLRRPADEIDDGVGHELDRDVGPDARHEECVAGRLEQRAHPVGILLGEGSGAPLGRLLRHGHPCTPFRHRPPTFLPASRAGVAASGRPVILTTTEGSGVPDGPPGATLRARAQGGVDVAGRRTMGAVDSIWLSMDRPDNLMVIDSIMLLDGAGRLGAGRGGRAAPARRPLPRVLAARGRTRPTRSACRTGRTTTRLLPEPAPAPRHARGARRHRDAAALRRGADAAPARPATARCGSCTSSTATRAATSSSPGSTTRSPTASRWPRCCSRSPTPTPTATSSRPTPRRSSPRPRRAAAALLSAASWVTRPVAAGMKGARSLLGEFPSALNPAYAVEALTVARQTGHIADKLLLGQNPESVLNGDTGVEKRAVWSRPRPLHDIKRVGRAAGATVNDVLVGAVSGAIAGYVRQPGRRPRGPHHDGPGEPARRGAAASRARQQVRPRHAAAADQPARSPAAPDRGQAAHGLHQAVARGHADLRHHQRDRPHQPGHRAVRRRLLRGQGDRRHDQRRGPA